MKRTDPESGSWTALKNHTDAGDQVREDITKANLEFYDQLYRPRAPWLKLIQALVSFDAQSKSKVNLRIVQPIFEDLIHRQDEIKVLDYGCGRGAFTLGIEGKATRSYCYDISRNALASIKEVMRFLHRQFEVIQFDNDGRIQPDDFSLIVASHVLEHVESDAELLDKLIEALHPGGYLLVNVPINEVWNDPKHIRAYSPESAKHLVTDAGLSILQIHSTDRWTGFLLNWEKNRPRAVFSRWLMRPLRFLLAMMPERLLCWSGEILLKRYPFQQFVLLGRKER